MTILYRTHTTFRRMVADVQRFLLTGHVGLCNAIRRTLLSDIQTEAPSTTRVITNVTCHTDEYLAHRVGLIPFRRVGDGNGMSLHASGPCDVTTAQFTGPAFEPIHANIVILRLDAGHELNLEITFDIQHAGRHARYSPCYAMGMIPAKDNDTHILSFGSNDGRTPEELLKNSLDHVTTRIDGALRLLADDTTCESFI
jgi:hypothetical protein